MRRYHTYPPHRAPVGALCGGSSMRTCRYAKSSDRSSMRRELYAALIGAVHTGGSMSVEQKFCLVLWIKNTRR